MTRRVFTIACILIIAVCSAAAFVAKQWGGGIVIGAITLAAIVREARETEP